MYSFSQPRSIIWAVRTSAHALYARSLRILSDSAGAGRTGTFIGYDILLNESKSIGNADVFGCVAKMRQQRMEMVQNCVRWIWNLKLKVVRTSSTRLGFAIPLLLWSDSMPSSYVLLWKKQISHVSSHIVHYGIGWFRRRYNREF